MNDVEERRFAKALSPPLSVSLAMMKEPITSDVIHCHTWYTFMAGFMVNCMDNPCDHHPQFGTLAPVEGGAARKRI